MVTCMHYCTHCAWYTAAACKSPISPNLPVSWQLCSYPPYHLPCLWQKYNAPIWWVWSATITTITNNTLHRMCAIIIIIHEHVIVNGWVQWKWSSGACIWSITLRSCKVIFSTLLLSSTWLSVNGVGGAPLFLVPPTLENTCPTRLSLVWVTSRPWSRNWATRTVHGQGEKVGLGICTCIGEQTIKVGHNS